MSRGRNLSFLLGILLLISVSSGQEGVVVLCAGDSITAAEYPRHLRRLLSQDGMRVKVLNYGRSGNTSGEYLRFLNRTKTALAQEFPDFVLLELGTNDVRVDGDHTPAARFGLNMKAIIAILHDFRNRRGEKTQVLLATIPPLPKKASPPFGPESAERVTSEINPLLQKIAAEEKLVLVDNYSLFLMSPQLLPDVHPSSEGYKLLAENWYKALKPLLKKD